MQSGAIDVADTNALLDSITRYKTMQNVSLRQAVAPDTVHLTLNGGQGRTLSDQKLRQAVFKAVDRQSIANAEIGKITPNPPLLGNHIYAQGTKEYKDNSGDLKFSVDKAKTVQVVADPNWWGDKPYLDAILFKVMSRPSMPDAMASGAIDVADTNALLIDQILADLPNA